MATVGSRWTGGWDRCVDILPALTGTERSRSSRSKDGDSWLSPSRFPPHVAFINDLKPGGADKRWVRNRGCWFLSSSFKTHGLLRARTRVYVEYILNIYEKRRSRKKLLIFKFLQDFFGKKFLSKYSLSFVKILTFFCQNTHLPGWNTGFFCQNTHLLKQVPVQ